jgi:hypothetical protein
LTGRGSYTPSPRPELSFRYTVEISSPHASSCRRNTGVGRFSVALPTFT